MLSHSPTQPENFQWLDKLIAQFNSLYRDRFVLKPGGYCTDHVKTVLHEKHGECIQVAYRVVFNSNPLNSFEHRLPVDDGPYLMQLIETTAEYFGGNPPLVTSKTKGQRDFCDWAIMPDGHGEIRIFFRKEQHDR